MWLTVTSDSKGLTPNLFSLQQILFTRSLCERFHLPKPGAWTAFFVLPFPSSYNSYFFNKFHCFFFYSRITWIFYFSPPHCYHFSSCYQHPLLVSCSNLLTSIPCVNLCSYQFILSQVARVNFLKCRFLMMWPPYLKLSNGCYCSQDKISVL